MSCGGIFVLCHVVAYLKILNSVTICLFGKEKSKNEYLFDSTVTQSFIWCITIGIGLPLVG